MVFPHRPDSTQRTNNQSNFGWWFRSRSASVCAACGSILSIKQTEYIDSTFDVGRSMFNVHFLVSHSIKLATSAASGWADT
jgi:hypothetical protein